MTDFQTQIPIFEELRGQRLSVRPYRLGDAEQLFAAINDSRAHLRTYLPFADSHQTIEETRDFITRTMANWLLREDFTMGIWSNDEGTIVGGIGFHVRSWDIPYFEIGYWLHHAAEGNGYVSEAVQLITDYLFDSLHAQRVEIRCDIRNTRSAAVARRLGFVEEGSLRNREKGIKPSDPPRTMLYFSLIPEDRTPQT